MKIIRVYWEIRKYPMGQELTKEQDEECIICDCGGYHNNVDLSTFPNHTLYTGNQYGNGLMVLLAYTPNHKVKSVRVA